MAWPMFTAPWMLVGAAFGALAIGVLHLLSVRQPPVLELPTARFVPDGEARAVARQPRPNDLLLLFLRVMAVLLAGLALSGMQWPSTRATVLQLVVTDSVVARDSVFTDSITRALQTDSALVEVVAARGVQQDPGALLVVATAQAARLVQQHATLERVELTVVVPSAAASWRGFEAWQTQWPGRLRVLTRDDSTSVDRDARSVMVQVTTGTTVADDPVQAWSRVPNAVGASDDATRTAARVVYIERRAGARRDSLAAQDATVLVEWPETGMPNGWEARAQPDTVGAVVAYGEVLTGPWERVARVGPALLARLEAGRDGTAGQVVAWWSDGEPAVIEQGGIDRCTRLVSLVVPRGSDALLSPAAGGLREAITGACGGAREPWAAVRGSLDSTSVTNAAPADAFRVAFTTRGGSDPRWLAPLLLGLSIACLLSEWLVRRREEVA